MSELTDQEIMTLEQIYKDYCKFEESKKRIPQSREEWIDSVKEYGKKLKDNDFIKTLINQYKMNKNSNNN